MENQTTIKNGEYAGFLAYWNDKSQLCIRLVEDNGRNGALLNSEMPAFHKNWHSGWKVPSHF